MSQVESSHIVSVSRLIGLIESADKDDKSDGRQRAQSKYIVNAILAPPPPRIPRKKRKPWRGKKTSNTHRPLPPKTDGNKNVNEGIKEIKIDPPQTKPPPPPGPPPPLSPLLSSRPPGSPVRHLRHRRMVGIKDDIINFEVVMVDCRAPPKNRKSQRGLVLNLARRSIHCYEHKAVKVVIPIDTIGQIERWASMPKRITIFSNPEIKGDGMNYLCDFIFGSEKMLNNFLIVVTQCISNVTIATGREGKPKWIKDSETKYCMLDNCEKPFSVTNRRHHCRRCGFVVCGSCSSKKAVLGENIGISSPVRVCDRCFRDTVAQRVSLLGMRSAFYIEGDDETPIVLRQNRTSPAESLSSNSGLDSLKYQQHSESSRSDRGESNPGKNHSHQKEASGQYDYYGFPLREGNCHSKPSWANYLKAQRQRWSNFLSHRTKFKFDKSDKELKSLVRRGIPPELRGHLWPLLSGSDSAKRAAKKGYYAELVETSSKNPPAILEQIEKDLSRTFPDHQKFEAGDFQSLLREVLTAYAIHNPKVGYCQSMNFICAVILLFCTNLEDAFWLFAETIENLCCVIPRESSVLPKGSSPILYHQQDLAGVIIDQAVFRELISRHLPKIAAQLELLEMNIDAVSTNWIMCLFATSLPIEVVLHIWDCIFLEGIKVLFRAGLALLKYMEKDIMACQSFEDIIYLFRGMRQGDYDVEKFMKMCFDLLWLQSFSRARIAELRESKISLVRLIRKKFPVEEEKSPPQAQSKQNSAVPSKETGKSRIGVNAATPSHDSLPVVPPATISTTTPRDSEATILPNSPDLDTSIISIEEIPPPPPAHLKKTKRGNKKPNFITSRNNIPPPPPSRGNKSIFKIPPPPPRRGRGNLKTKLMQKSVEDFIEIRTQSVDETPSSSRENSYDAKKWHKKISRRAPPPIPRSTHSQSPPHNTSSSRVPRANRSKTPPSRVKQFRLKFENKLQDSYFSSDIRLAGTTDRESTRDIADQDDGFVKVDAFD